MRILKAMESSSESSHVPSSNFYDAHMAYNIRSDEDAMLLPPTARWMPIDVDLITPHHSLNNKVPGLFTPKSLNSGKNRCGCPPSGPHDHKGTARGRGRRGRRGKM